MDPKKILGFAVYFFIALNISTLIIIQFSLDKNYAAMVYAGTIFIATLPCVYIVQGTTVLEIVSGISAGLAGLFVFPVAAVAGTGAAVAVGNPFAAGVGLLTVPQAGAAVAGALAASTTPAQQIFPLLPRSRENSFNEDADWVEEGGGRRRKNRRGRGRLGNGLFAIPLY